MSLRKETKYIILHCSAYDGEHDIVEIRRWHKARGFDDVGYHFVIPQDGSIQFGRCLSEEGAHCKAQGRNHDSIGVCLCGLTRFSEAQFKALVVVIELLRSIYGDLSVHGHREYEPNKTCPAFDYSKYK